MCCVAARRSKHHFRIAREFDFTRGSRMIGQRHAAYFDVILAAHEDFEQRGYRPVLAEDFRAILVEIHAVAFRFDTGRLVARRPDASLVHIAQEDVAAPGIAGRVLPPAGHGDIAPFAEA